MRRWTVLVPALAVVVAAITLGGPNAAANHTSQTDPDDSPGRFDLREVRLDHNPVPRWTFVTFAGWRIDDVWDAGYLVVRLDTKGDEGVDHVVIVRSDGRRLLATLYRIRADGSQVALEALDAGKAGPRGATVRVALHKLDIGRSRIAYHWSAVSSYTGTSCPHTCFDAVPDEGMIEQLLPGASPSPSPTPSPTTSPSPTAGPAA
jgi:hypothetical protein